MKFDLFDRRGFTLLEVMIVVAIIAMLSTVAMFSYQDARKSSRDAQRISDINQLQLALRMYKDSDKDSSYPDNLTKLVPSFLTTKLSDPNGLDYNYALDYPTSDCSGKSVIYANMEVPSKANWATVCPGDTPDTSSRYGFVLQ